MMQDQNGPLAVKFFQKECQNNFQTNLEGRPIAYMADFVRIEIPGNQLSIIETFASEEHKKRFPVQWAMYLNEKAEGRLDGGDVQGTMLRDWPLLTAAQATELRHFKFYTVEQVANASDAQIGSLGMLVGMSPYAFRDKAKAYLAQAKDSAVVQVQAEELRAREQEIADLKAQIARIAADQPKRGRPAKERAEDQQEAA